ncbi:hypothetical protein ACFQY0_03380 [Haloferula chungangensis]|uniref:RRM domain-containing protein n=1 Tax=Haloferula chungangensis TaxID=1048331 RepID=A0ABW2L3S5_9BACT
MSNETSDSQGSGGQRRRSRGGRNRNRNRRTNQDGSPRNDNREGGRDGGNREGGRQRSGNRGGSRRESQDGQGRTHERRQPKPAPLTWWQKLLKSIGLYKEPVPPKRAERGEPKSNTRVATGGAESGEPKKRGERKPRKSRREPRDNDEHRERRPPENINVESNRLYLGNLSYEASESDLEELFKGIGNVRRVEIVYNRQTHRSKGYGFIDMMNKDEATRAVEVLHDQFFMGRRLVVNGAKSQGPADGEDEESNEPKEAPKPATEAPAAEEAPTIEEAPPAEEPKVEEFKP